jgi:hypothetical protein
MRSRAKFMIAAVTPEPQLVIAGFSKFTLLDLK